jgi:hypothetical protein
VSTRFPVLIIDVARYCGVDPQELHDAIAAALPVGLSAEDAISRRSRIRHLVDSYAQELGIEADTVCTALIACHQNLEGEEAEAKDPKSSYNAPKGPFDD